MKTELKKKAVMNFLRKGNILTRSVNVMDKKMTSIDIYKKILHGERFLPTNYECSIVIICHCIISDKPLCYSKKMY